MKKIIVLILIAVSIAGKLNSVPTISTGNINLPEGAIYGELGWEEVLDIKNDGSNIYVLGVNHTYPKTYILKYSSEGNLVSSTTVSENVDEKYFTFITTNGYLYLAGNKYVYDLMGYLPKDVIISKYDENLNFISSTTYSGENTNLEFKSITADDSFFYLCANSSNLSGGGNGFVAKIDVDLSTQSYSQLQDSYYCGENIVVKGNIIYFNGISNNKVYITTISTSLLDISSVAILNNIPSFFDFGISDSYLYTFACLFENNQCGLYKYDLNSLNNFISSTTVLSNEFSSNSKSFSLSTSGISLSYHKFNPLTGKQDVYILIYSTEDLKIINEFNISHNEDNYVRKSDINYNINGSTLYLTGVTYFCKNFGCDNDIRIIGIKNIDVITNKPPVLSFPPELVHNFGIFPGKIVPLGMPVTFYVEYRDLEKDNTEYVKILLDNIEYDMNFVSLDPVTGIMLFSYSTTPVAGEHTFRFEAKDDQGNDAIGFPVENTHKLIVVKGFYGSLGDTNKTVNLEIPYEEYNKKIIVDNEQIYLLANNPDGSSSFIGKLSTATDTENITYLPFMENNELVIWDMVSQGSGNYQILASSRVSQNNYEIFTATMSSNFNIIESSTIVSGLNNVQARFELYLNNGNRYIFADGDEDFKVAKCNDSGCLISGEEIVINEQTNDKKTKLSKGFIDSDGSIYAIGYYYEDESTDSEINGFIGKLKPDLSDFDIVSTFSAPGVVSFDKFMDIIKDGDYFYVAGYSNNGVKNYGFILKYDTSTLTLEDSKLFSVGKNDIVKAILKTDEGKILVGGDTILGTNLLQTRSPFLAKFDPENLEILSIYHYPYKDNANIIFQDVKIGGSDLYLVTDIKPFISSYKLDSKIEKLPISIIGEQEVNVELITKSTSGLSLSGMQVGLIPFEDGKLNIGKAKIGYFTDNNGKVSLKALKNTTYLVAITKPGYGPTLKQEFMDPYQRFIKTFTRDTTLNYNFSTLSKSSQTFKVIVSSVVVGYPVFVSIEMVGTKEPVAFGFTKATDSVITVEVYNVPELEAGKYKIDVSIPEILSKNEVVYSHFPATYTAVANYFIDFSLANVAGGNYEEQKQKEQPVFTGIVRDNNNNPIPNAQVRLSNNNFMEVKYTDVNGRFSFYTSTSVICEGQSSCSADLMITKKGYSSLMWNIPLPSYEFSYYLIPATYTVSGYVTYNGVPLSGVKIRAGGYDNNIFSFGGADSYKPENMNNKQIYANNFAITDSSGYFIIENLTDGNVGLYVDWPVGKFINMGNDTWENNNANKDDDIRIVISSSGAIPPQFPLNNPCDTGKVWVLDSSGSCKGISPYTFELAKPINETATLNIKVKYDEESPSDISGSFLIHQNIKNAQGIERLVPLLAGTTGYTVKLTSGSVVNNKFQPFEYCLTIVSDMWVMRGEKYECFNFASSDIKDIELILTRAGKIKGKVIKPEGSIFFPQCCEWPKIYIESYDKSYSFSQDFSINYDASEPVFEYPLPPGKYTVYFKTENYPIAIVENVNIEAGKTTEVNIKMKDGLVVKPNITGLGESNYSYAILAVPAGLEMKKKNINDFMFGDEMNLEKYLIRYDTATSEFETKYLTPGKYDFYLVLGSKFEPEKMSLKSFINFIGKEKNKIIQKDPLNPDYGSTSQPIADFNIYGSLGKSSVKGKIKGKNIIRDKDFEKIFAKDLQYLISLVPTIMIYDSVGELRGFAHSILNSSDALNSFMEGIDTKSTETIVNVFISSSSYYIPNIPQGKYTAVFLSPNYPVVTKEIEIKGETQFDLDFDEEIGVSNKVYGRIIDNSSVPVRGARVFLKHKIFEKMVYTDDNGEYVVNDLPHGLYRMEVSKDGYVGEGRKFSITANENMRLDFTIKKSQNSIIGKVYLSKFPNPLVSGGVKIVAYNETKNIEGENYISKIETVTSDDGGYEIKGVEAGDEYRIVASYPGKLTQTIIVKSAEGIKVADDIVFIDIPPQIDVKLRRDKSSLEVQIKSPKEILSVPKCEYVAGNNFDENNASQLALVKNPGNVYVGRFNISKLVRYYTIRITAGDIEQIEKIINYDVVNDIASENYISNEIYVGGEVYMDKENEEYTGIEMDPGTFVQSTSTISQYSASRIKIMGVGDNDLIGGFFTALPTIRTVKTPKAEMNLSEAITSIMASEIYDIDISNAQPNKFFTLTLKYDKESIFGNISSLRIYQYNEDTKQWEKVEGTYTVDPMLGTVSVEIPSLKASETNNDTLTSFGRKKLGMSAIQNGRFVPQNTSTPQSGRFAVFKANPPTGTSYSGERFEVYNIPNPFNLKSKVVTISADGGSWYTGNYTTEGTIIKYHLPSGKSGNIKLVVYNIAGEKVRTLDEGYREAGYIYYSEWDGRNDKNEKCASGVYFLVAYLNGEKIGKPHKMAVVK